MNFRLHWVLNSRRAASVVAAALFVGVAALVGPSAAQACQPASSAWPTSLVAGFALASDSESGSKAKDGAEARPESKFSIAGTIASVNYAKNTIDVQGSAGRVTIAITPTTAIAVHGQAGGISDLRPGIHVSANGVSKNGVYVALTITIK